MSKEYNEALDVPEGISVGNWTWGDIVIRPEATSADNSVTISGVALTGEGDVCFQASVKSAYPWQAAGEVGVAPPEGNTAFEDDPTSFRIFFYRVTTAATRVHWMAWRDVV